ncbi:MAG: hypothetical protein HQK56_14665 [Deltaproteobacteria bacterium]|nr:hypothetical protein [Deltaproteobacteria bacterium]
MTLFTKKGCTKCDFIKDKFDFDALGIKIEVLGPENPDALAHLAWHELVEVAQKKLPILVLDDNSYLTDVVPIQQYLRKNIDN